MKLSPEAKDSLCECVEEWLADGKSWLYIEEKLAGRLGEKTLAELPSWHASWKERQRRKEKCEARRRAGDAVDVEHVAASGDVMDWSLAAAGGGVELVRYLAERIVGRDRKTTWRYLYSRALTEGQTVEQRKKPGKEAGVTWLCRAVIFRTGDRIDHVEPEARVRRWIKPESAIARKNRWKHERVEVEKMQLAKERLANEDINAAVAALISTYLGPKSGIKSGAHLGRLTNRTRAAVSARKLRIAQEYYDQTEGQAGFENLHSARRRRK